MSTRLYKILQTSTFLRNTLVWTDLDHCRRVGCSTPNQNVYGMFYVILVTHSSRDVGLEIWSWSVSSPHRRGGGSKIMRAWETYH